MDASEIVKNIEQIYNRRRAAIYAYGLKWGAEALNYFRSVQPPSPGTKGQFWNNRTGSAALEVFVGGIREDDEIGWFMAHFVSYGVYLELANNRANEAIRPIVQRFAGRFIRDVQDLYAD
jgi:hypothetical protein